MTKFCKKCLIEKPILMFVKSNQHKDGLHPWCRLCRTAYANKRYHIRSYNFRPDLSKSHKVCSACKNNKSISEFHKSKIEKDGFSYRCKKCKAESFQRDYAKHSEAYKSRAKERLYRTRAGDYGIGVSLKDWDYLLRQYRNSCAYCGSRNNLTRDHVIPLSRGGTHTVGNVVPACWPCNSAKGSKLLVEFLYNERLR